MHQHHNIVYFIHSFYYISKFFFSVVVWCLFLVQGTVPCTKNFIVLHRHLPLWERVLGNRYFSHIVPGCRSAHPLLFHG